MATSFHLPPTIHPLTLFPPPVQIERSAVRDDIRKSLRKDFGRPFTTIDVFTQGLE
jgi:hypothetical protein